VNPKGEPRGAPHAGTPAARWWFRDTLFMRLFLLMWAALVVSHLVAYLAVTSGRPPPGPGGGGFGSASLPTFPSLPPTPGLPDAGRPPGPGPGGPASGGPGGPGGPRGRAPGLPAHMLVLDYGVRLLIIGAAAWVGARWLSRPVRHLVGAASTLGTSLGGPEAPRLDETRGTAEVREAAQVFNRMASELHEQFRSRGLLMASLSHDLRTPLTRMRMRLETVAQEPLAQRCVADIREMNDLIETALEVFRNADAQEPAQHTDLLALVQSLADDLIEQGQPVTLAGSSLVARIQPVATRRIVSNLLGNALRYGVRADVSVRAQGSWACVTIDDLGPGIPEAQLKDVFRPFYRVDTSRSRGTGGTGLGLYIVRDFTWRQGGHITLSNRAGGGLRAELRLPLR